jgi:hypothetical protein
VRKAQCATLVRLNPAALTRIVKNCVIELLYENLN